MKKILLCFAAGSLGGLANSLAAWQMGELGVTAMAGVAIAPHLSPVWLYPRIVWGGLWGLLFVLPLINSRPLVKGAFMSLFPSAVQLFILFPNKAHLGLGGLSLGMMTPFFVLFFNWIWGVVTALVLRFSK